PGMGNQIKNAYLLGDPQRTPLAFRNDPTGKSITVPSTDQFLPVVVVEFEGSLDVQQPAVNPDARGIITLLPESGDHFYNSNGEGYYDPLTLCKERWTFAVNNNGNYRIEVRYKPGKFSRLLDINVDGKIFRTSLYGDEKASAIAGIAELTASPN